MPRALFLLVDRSEPGTIDVMKHVHLQRLKRKLKALRSQQGATMLEWVLLLGFIAIPSFLIMRVGMETLLGHFDLILTINAMPFP